MFNWLFNIYGVVREVNARMMERGEALKRIGEDVLREVNQFLFEDDAALMHDSEKESSSLLRGLRRVGDKRKE